MTDTRLAVERQENKVNVRLSAEDMAGLEAKAKELGLTPAQVSRMWIHQQLNAKEEENHA